MPAGKITMVANPGYRHHKSRTYYKRKHGRKKWGKLLTVPRNRGLYRKPRPGGQALTIPLKVAYTQTVSGGGTAVLDIDQNISLGNMPTSWFTRYAPIFHLVRINKVKIKIICPYNIGQANVGASTMYKAYSKKAITMAETPPGSETEWLNIPSAKQKLFNTKSNTLTYYFTPFYEAPQSATIAKRLMYKQWFEFPSGPTQCIDHGGIIAAIMAQNGGNVTSTEKFTIQTTLYIQMRGLTQL